MTEQAARATSRPTSPRSRPSCTQEMHKLSMNPRMVEGLAAPVKELAPSALELDEEIVGRSSGATATASRT